MTRMKKRVATVLITTALTISLTISATAEEAPPIRVSSYKGSTLNIKDRSSLIIDPSGMEYTVTSSESYRRGQLQPDGQHGDTTGTDPVD